MSSRSKREGHRIEYAEYSDDDFDSPVKGVPRVTESDEEEVPQAKKVNGSQGILQFMQTGVNNAKHGLEAAASKPKQAKKAHNLDDTDEDMADDADFIEDSDMEEEQPCPKPRKKEQKQQRSSHRQPEEDDDDEPQIVSSEEAESDGGEKEVEEEEEEAVDLISDDSSSSDDDAVVEIKDVSDEEEVKEEPFSKEKNDGNNLRPRVAPPPTLPARRSARVDTKKTYNIENMLADYAFTSDEEEEDAAALRRGALSGGRAGKTGNVNAENDDDLGAALPRARGARSTAANVKKSKLKTKYSSGSDDDDGEDSSSSSSESESDSEYGGGTSRKSKKNDGGGDGEYGTAGENGDHMMGDDDEDDDGDGGGQFAEEEGELADEDAIFLGVERILAVRPSPSDPKEKELRVKIAGWSFRRARWVPRSVLLAAGRQQLVRNFERKASQGGIDPYGDLDDGVHPDWLEIERVFASKDISRLGKRYMVKWKGLGYADATWEAAAALDESDADRVAVARYQRFADEAQARVNKENEEDEEEEPVAINTMDVPDFCNGRSLRPYQVESLEWMAKHWSSEQNCILGDEMGLGKTAQSIAVLAFQRQFGLKNGPFLVIAPLTTLGHWQREITTWTDMDCMVYAGSAADRAIAQKHDLWIAGSGGGGDGDGGARGGRRVRKVKPHVILSSYETVLRDASLFESIGWETIIIDEAHRMKTVGSATRAAISTLDTSWLLLLTGTPVQNNMRELYGLMNLLDPYTYGNENEFLERFGDERTGMSPEQVRELQLALKPILLRRMKEDVETLPEKEECIIWTQLTIEQRAYYKAIFEKQIGTLLGGVSQKNAPNLRNLAMELRKVCCHPFLCNGLEEDVAARRRLAGLPGDEISTIVGASGKMLLLHKLLPKLRSEGHKVLIFSQFKIMLDVLEDYMRAAQFPCERIDGSTSSRDRQAAIDRYSKPDSEGFVFLLSTRAGGQGITLTAADTCIIYDSDWNPQNDLQAMARCHRIGQEKDVTIYRLVSKDTYEEHVFRISSRKYGLDEAILGGIAGGGAAGSGGDELDGKKIADLLKHGAHCLDKVDEANAETEAFAEEDIDEILKGRTEKRQIGGRAGNTFSVATFAVEGGEGSGDVNGGGDGRPTDDKEFWKALLPDAAAEHDAAKLAAKQGHLVLAPRSRKRVNYREALRKKAAASSSEEENGDDSDFGPDPGENDSAGEGEGESGADGDASLMNGGDGSGGRLVPPARKKLKTNELKAWAAATVSQLFDQLMRYGFTGESVTKAATAAGILSKGYRLEDAPGVAAVLRAMVLAAPTAVDPKPSRIPSLPNEILRQKNILVKASGGGGYLLTGCASGTTPITITNASGGGGGNNTTTSMTTITNSTTNNSAAAAAAPPRSNEILQKEAEKLAAIEIARAKQIHRAWELATANAASTLAVSVGKAKGITFPQPAHRALQDAKFAQRLITNAPSYAQHMRELDILSRWGESGENAPLYVHKSSSFPTWWGRSDDTRLLKGLFTLGWAPLRKQSESVQAVLVHPEFGFPERLVEAVVVQQTAGGGGNDGGGIKVEEKASVKPASSPHPAAASAAATGTITSHSPEKEETVVMTAPVFGMASGVAGGAPPRAYTHSEWGKLKDTLVKHVKNMLVAVQRQAVIVERAAALTAAGGGGGGSSVQQRLDGEGGGALSRPESSADMYLSRASSMDSLATSTEQNGAGNGGGGSTLLWKQVLQREANKKLPSSATAGGGAKEEQQQQQQQQGSKLDSKNGEVPKKQQKSPKKSPKISKLPAKSRPSTVLQKIVVFEEKEVSPSVEGDDPIESFSDGDGEDDFKTTINTTAAAAAAAVKKTKTKKSAAAAATTTAATIAKKKSTSKVATPKSAAMGSKKNSTDDTPGSGLVPALNVFKETRGEFTGPDSVGGGPGGAGTAPTTAPSSAKKKKKNKAEESGGAGGGGGGVEKIVKKRKTTGQQQSLLSMPRVQPYLTTVTSGGRVGQEATVAGKPQQQQRQQNFVVVVEEEEEEEIIDLAMDD